MKKFLSAVLTAALALSFTACGGTQNSSDDTHYDSVSANGSSAANSDTSGSSVTDSSAASSNTSDSSVTDSSITDNSMENDSMSGESNDIQNFSTAVENSSDSEESLPPTNEPSSKILIAYFTWAENTHVDDPSAVDVDATTSASVLLPGNAAKMASWIQQEVGGDLFSIVVTEPYSSNYDECLDRAADEKAANARPALVNHVENMDEYDIVFLGFPNWWYTVPMAIHTFLEEYDFSGKTIVPFVTHGTGGLASTIRDITADLPNSVTILEPIGIYRPEVDSSQSRVKEWAASLDI